MVYSTRQFVVCLSVCHFVLVFFSPFSIAITSLGEERANLSAFRTFVRFVLVSSSSWGLGRAAVCDCGTPWTFLLTFFYHTHLTTSPDLAPYDFFFPKLKTFLSGRRYRSRQSIRSDVYQYLTNIPKSAYRNVFWKWIHRLKLCISSHGEWNKWGNETNTSMW